MSLYVAFTFAFSWLFLLLKYLGQVAIIPGFFVTIGSLFILGPLFGVVMVFLIEKKNIWQEIKKMFRKDTPKQIYWFVCISPFILSIIAYIAYILISGEAFALGMSIQMTVPIALIIFITGGPVEEFGWRGMLLPDLRKRYSFLLTALILGLIHGLWHLPLHYIDGTVQQAMPIWQFMTMTVLITVSYVFVFEYTKNLLPMILLHWLANFSSAMFIYWQADSGRYAIFTATLLLDIALIVIYYKRKQKAVVSTA